jgi:pimeloyl-ACP methyl ester carboxylesterase
MLTPQVSADVPGELLSQPPGGDALEGADQAGRVNTMAPTHFRIADLSEVEPKPPVLWLRGADDVIVSDTSLYDLAYLGSIGAVPGWPGEQACPPQPMVAQTRAVLNGYAVAGGRYREVVIEDAGHGPHLDQPERFLGELADHLAGR